MPCHVGIGMAEDFCQYVYGHSVFNRQTSERMPGNVRRQRLVDIADARQLLQIGVHFAVARYGQHLSALSAIQVVLVLSQEFHRMRQQGDAAHYGGFLAVLVNPQLPGILRADMFRAQVIGIRKGKSRQAAEREHIPDAFYPLVRHRFGYQNIQFRFGQVVFRLVVFGFKFVVLKRILFDPLVADSIQHKVFKTAQQIDRTVGLAVMGRLDKGVQSVEVLVINHIQRNIFLFVLRLHILFQVAKQAVILVRRELGDPCSDLFLPFVAILPELGKKQTRIARGVFKTVFDSKARRLFALLD